MTKKRNFFVKIVSNWLDFYQAAWYYSFRPGIASGLKKNEEQTTANRSSKPPTLESRRGWKGGKKG
jgi:hypothetical protein